MATTNKKEYSIKINGVDTSIKDVTKLEDAVKSLDKTIISTNTTVNTSVKNTTSKTKALTEEEKAVQKLEATQKRIAEVNSEANRAQIEATKELREKTREVTREIAINQLAEGSIASMGMQLTNLRNEYENLSKVQRENTDEGGALLEKIQALDAEYKNLRESTGNFRDSVGNYEKAVGGLKKLESSLSQVEKTSTGLQNSMITNSSLMSLFGGVSEATTLIQGQLSQIIGLVTAAQELSTQATKEGAVATAASAVIDGIKTGQLKAKAIAESLATKNTIAATVAQRIFNAVAKANPYVLLAMALLTVVGALGAYALSAGKSEGETKKYYKSLDDLAFSSKEAADAHDVLIRKIRDIQVEIDVARGKISEYNGDLIKIANRATDAIGDVNKQLKTDIDELNEKYNSFGYTLKNMWRNIFTPSNYFKDQITEVAQIEGEAKAQRDKIAEQEAKEAELRTQQEINLNREKAKKAAEDAKREAEKRAEEAKRRAEEAYRLSLERASLELAAVRSLEDSKVKLIGNSYEQQKKIINLTYAREIEDLKIKLNIEKNLSDKARKAINDNILILSKVRDMELVKLAEEIAAEELATIRELEDQKNALILGNLDKRTDQINKTYDRQIEDAQKRLDTEKQLTEEQRKAINEMIVNYEKQRINEINQINAEDLARRSTLELQTLEDTLKIAQDKIDEVVVKNKKGIWAGVIDVDATKTNLIASNNALDEYINSLKIYQTNLKKSHEETLKNLKVGTVEYEEEMQKYAKAHEDASKKIKDSQKKQEENTKTSNDLNITQIKEMAEKIAGYADIAAQAITGVFDTWNMGLQASLDSLNEQLDVINDHYDEAKEKREAYTQDVENIEERLRNASGGTAEALKSQLQDAMHQREEAAREEARLQKEKEKKEAEIAKKEKQMKRNDLISNMAMAMANTAQGVTKMLSLVWPLNLIMAGFVGTMGAVQVGIMGKQLAKLAEGGEIIGPSHDNGGVNILIDGKPSYEAQGGEFMVNDVSYSANKELVRFINDSKSTVTASDLAGILPGSGETPIVYKELSSNNNAEVVEAIEAIDMRPTVSVTDILDVTDEVTTVRGLSGF